MIPTYNNASRTRRTPPTPDDASRMQYRHKTCATRPGPGPIVYYIYILVAPCFKNILRLEAGYPALRCHILEDPPQRLEKIPLGFGLVGIIIRDRNNFSARDKRPATGLATSKQLQSGVRSRRTSCPRSSSSRGKGTRRGAGSATCSRWRTSGARSSSSGSARGAPAAVR